MRLAAIAVPLLLAMAGSPALAENWRKAGSMGDVVGYVDTDDIKRDGDKVRFWTQIRYPEPQGLPSGHRFDRMAALVEIDCTAKTYRTLRTRANLGDRLVYSGKVRKDPLSPVRPGTNVDAQRRAVCLDDWGSVK